MTEHVQKCPRGNHSWRIGHDLNFASDRFGERFVYCFFHECNATMTWSKAEARLNENETLKADKRLLMHVVHGRAMASSLPKHLKEE